MAMVAPIAMIGLSLLGTMQQAGAARSQGNSQAAAMRYNAAINDRNAQIARDQGAADAALFQRDAVRKLAAIRAASAASGFGADSTSLDLLASSAYEAEQERQTILYKSEIKATGYADQANLDRMSANSAQRKGANTATGAIIGGLSSTIGMLPKLG